MSQIPPLFRCAHCDEPIHTTRGLVLCQGTPFCCDPCHGTAHPDHARQPAPARRGTHED